MIQHKQSNLTLNHKSALKLSLIISLLFVFFMFIGFIFGGKEVHLHKVSIINVIIQYVSNLLVLFLLYEFCFWVFRKKWGHHKRLFLALLGTIGVAIVLSPVFSEITHLFSPSLENDLHNRIIVIGLIKNLVLSFVVYLSTLSFVVVIHNQQTLLENQRLLAENIRSRYEALKNQLNPHFLFNSLNTLDGLIGFDDEKAHDYLQNLSSIFRYTIQNKEITTLKEELCFVESYANLMKIRYGDNFKIQYAIDEKYNNFNIMPISLQLLIENAIKHNVINDKTPLTIYIETTQNNTIKVSNTIQPKINTEAGEGVGLANLVERYRLLFNMEVTITQNDVFAVEIPLINKI
ncbi:MAG: histidine kinase [Lentimicrobiaceae bacterium]|nr:histidine kinase [Lentimicrobiaceae bacterium]